MPSEWVKAVQAYAEKHNITLKEAMGSTELHIAYKQQHPTRVPKLKGQTENVPYDSDSECSD